MDEYYSESEDYDGLVSVPEGDYQLKLVQVETAIMFKTPRLVLTFEIVSFGEHFKKVVKSYYGVERIIGKPSRNGRCKHKATGDFMCEFYKLFPREPKRRLDRIPLDKYFNNIILGKVVYVKSNCRQRGLPEQLWHSKVGALLKIVD